MSGFTASYCAANLDFSQIWSTQNRRSIKHQTCSLMLCSLTQTLSHINSETVEIFIKD